MCLVYRHDCFWRSTWRKKFSRNVRGCHGSKCAVVIMSHFLKENIGAAFLSKYGCKVQVSCTTLSFVKNVPKHVGTTDLQDGWGSLYGKTLFGQNVAVFDLGIMIQFWFSWEVLVKLFLANVPILKPKIFWCFQEV